MISKIAQVIGSLLMGFAIFIIACWLWVALPGIVFAAVIVVLILWRAGRE